jgi:type IV pilus assembly protein PilW
MTHLRKARCARASQGATLIELMVALTIGLMITGAVLAAYQGASSADKTAEAQSRMNEDAQAALGILVQQLRMAGNNPDQPNRVDSATATLSSRRNPVYTPTPTYAGYATVPASFAVSAFAIRGCDGVFGNVQTASDIDHLSCAPGASTAPNAIAVSYEADRFNAVPTSVANGSLPTDCLGKPLATITATVPTLSGAVLAPTEVHYAVADNRFYIDSWGSVPSLNCKGNGIDSIAQALVENIEDLQFSYGVTGSTPAVAGRVAGYLTASELATDAALALLANDAARWQKVVTVRVCIVARSQDPVVASALSARYIKCDGSLETAPPDLRLRHAYSTTVVLRNRRL